MKKALAIAGFDPSGGAGIQADLKVFRALGVYGLSVVSSITAQNSEGVKSIISVGRQFLKKQLDVLLCDLTPDSTKIGMLYSESNVKTVADMIRRYSLINVVADPIILSSSGKRLAERNTPDAIRKYLFPLCSVITPNIHEASVFSGINIKTGSDMKRAAVRLRDYGPENVIITGGHIGKDAADLFYNGDFYSLRGKRIKGEYHGTGCVFSSAISASLARGESALAAARTAKRFINRAFRKTFSTGKGMKLFNI